jgi:molybdopterin-guanine dinucleotide biosynthesis protein A
VDGRNEPAEGEEGTASRSSQGPGGTVSTREPLGVVLAGGRGSRLGGAKPTAELAGRPLVSYPLAALAAAGLDAVVVAKPGTDLDGTNLGGTVGKPDTDLGDTVAKPDTNLGGTDPGGRPLARHAPGGRPLARQPGLKTTAPTGASQRTTAPDGAGQRSTAGEGLVAVLLEPEEPVHPLAGIVAALRQTGRPLVVLGCDFPFVPPALLRALADAPEPLVVPAPGGEPQPLVARWTPALLPALEVALAGEEPLRRTVGALSPRLLDDAELARFGDPARVSFNVNTPADLAAAARLL